ncbi:hypothetical protein O3M35_008783 [Rhynocoris fuscipes]|uniref:tRNA-splicing endonuclease subunit Sen2 n=1 Tax=Rhynocoris fuscipes TaxID=488301 RepID=A0AAW1D885_9HEMI
MELKSPTPKRKGHLIPKAAPLPITSESSSFFFDDSSYDTFSGFFNGCSVIVDDPEEMKALYSMGCFGKSSLSKGFPNFDKHRKDEPLVLKDYQWERRKEWSDKLCSIIANLQLNKNKDNVSNENDDKSNDSSNSNDLDEAMEINNENSSSIDMNTAETSNEINLSISGAYNVSASISNVNEDSKNILVINDFNDDENLYKLNPHLETEPQKTVMEVLYLSLEEAFFLSFALGCLQVMDLSGKPLSILQLWRTFTYTQSDFIENYVAYHYFRAKGWVVKSGLKFGVQFLLYKDGPSFFHASYGVLVESIKPIGNSTLNHRVGELTWDKMNSLNRMAETCNKEILVCKVQWPEIADEDLENPLILKKFKVKEFLLRRWQPCQEKQM